MATPRITVMACIVIVGVTFPVFAIRAPVDRMFPDGVEHDFGTVAAGTRCKHAFRVVNTGRAALHILDLRIS